MPSPATTVLMASQKTPIGPVDLVGRDGRDLVPFVVRDSPSLPALLHAKGLEAKGAEVTGSARLCQSMTPP